MDEADWWSCLESCSVLREVVLMYHPAGFWHQAIVLDDPIQRVVCRAIRRRVKLDPLLEFDNARKTRNVHTMMRLLGQTWMGVPESPKHPEGVARLCLLLTNSPGDEE